MTSQAPKTAVVLLIIALVASMLLSTKVAERREHYVIRPPKTATLIRAGFNKMLSHIAWMRLIQLRGEMDKVTPDRARVLEKKFDNVTNLDPMFARAYEEGALNIEHADADAALRLLDKAMEVNQMKSWKIPFTAAFIAKMRKKNDQKALEYIEKAVRNPERPSYVKRFAINLEAGLPGKDPLQVLNLWVDYYDGGASKMGMGGPGPNVPMAGGSPMLDESDRRMALARISRLSADIIGNAQKELLTEKDANRKKNLQDRVTEVQRLVKVVYGGAHVCTTCFRPYEPGDRFCKFDGKGVEVYGICSNAKCLATVGKAAYCPKCGAKSN